MDIFSFHGRANRVDFWVVSIGLTMLHLLFTLLAGLFIGLAFGHGLTEPAQAVAAGAFALVVQLAFLWPITAVAVRRSHDRGMSGWWYGAYALFGVALSAADAALLAMGRAESGTETLVLDALGLGHIGLSLLFLVILGFLPGTRRENRYGLPPGSRHENYRAPPVE